ncbi:MAG: hypothetical protein HKN23_03135 [Verrucomicrobiales bacterium]|nr:hypothetical protein [Verrucomicrobiales bacterium]
MRRADRNRWWHWPSFLGLDAPAVVCVWIWLFARGFGETVEPSVFVAAFCAVWSVYLADRLIDVRLCRDWEKATARLWIGRRFRIGLAILLALPLGTGIVLLSGGFLPVEVVKRGLLVTGGVAIYFSVFVLPPFVRRKKFPGKEFGVGLFFAAGVFAAIGPVEGMIRPLIYFALLAAFNCLVISARDHEADSVNDPGGAATWWPSIRGDLLIAGIVLTLLLLTGPIRATASMMIATSSMTVLHLFANRLTPATVRAFADFCLLLPFPLAFL